MVTSANSGNDRSEVTDREIEYVPTVPTDNGVTNQWLGMSGRLRDESNTLDRYDWLTSANIDVTCEDMW